MVPVKRKVLVGKKGDHKWATRKYIVEYFVMTARVGDDPFFQTRGDVMAESTRSISSIGTVKTFLKARS